MADDRNTPEKQLLRLIEETKGGKGGASRGTPGLGPKISFRNLLEQAAGRLSFLGRLTRRRASDGLRPPLVNLAVVNQVLMAVAVALLVYLVSDAAAAVIQLGRPINLAPKREAPAPATSESVSPLNDSAYYLQKVASRDIFKEGGQPVVKQEAAAPVEESAATSNLSLVGISWSANPDVIIEDKESKRTYFVKRGQVIGDGVKVEAIFKDHVVLSHDGQEFELR
ncbi:MAG TPA: type II secretion system protein N [Candidatus Eisenbacteria bacterium]|nr:type II secretion system protein N [Candidatus Eisenbacteria bacterium]